MDTDDKSEKENINTIVHKVYFGLNDANQKLDHIIQNLKEVYHTPIRCPFYDPRLNFKNNENNHASDYL